ncbi:hypothetical protein TGPRC2_314038 [Toxoplasma gondii TgCatPRC2]|uniref:Uncharacterized protein n=1 Tax=Toxoplasma gondii TgCatPRC2 TaxID=1130821 RepID=A0A151H7R6_TOXGO|nr:hypothetical protein TGPRC2_314038 [Toxoplasma gondii TgCatPRC2]
MQFIVQRRQEADAEEETKEFRTRCRTSLLLKKLLLLFSSSRLLVFLLPLNSESSPQVRHDPLYAQQFWENREKQNDEDSRHESARTRHSCRVCGLSLAVPTFFRERTEKRQPRTPEEAQKQRATEKKLHLPCETRLGPWFVCRSEKRKAGRKQVRHLLCVRPLYARNSDSEILRWDDETALPLRKPDKSPRVRTGQKQPLSCPVEGVRLCQKKNLPVLPPHLDSCGGAKEVSPVCTAWSL